VAELPAAGAPVEGVECGRGLRRLGADAGPDPTPDGVVDPGLVSPKVLEEAVDVVVEEAHRRRPI
jgi:hypothetical protein